MTPASTTEPAVFHEVEQRTKVELNLAAAVDAQAAKKALWLLDPLEAMVLVASYGLTGEPITLPLAPIYQGGFSTQPITAKFAQANLQLLTYDARSITLPPSDPTARSRRHRSWRIRAGRVRTGR